MSMLLRLILPFYDFAIFDLSPLTVCINCSFFTFIFVVLLPTFEYTYFVILYVITAIFEK